MMPLAARAAQQKRIQQNSSVPCVLVNIKGAAETIRENNPLAGCCAEVCPYGQLCEQACSRTGIDKPIEIGKLQKILS